MSLARLYAKTLARLLLTLAAVFAVFYFWASSPNLPPGQQATIAGPQGQAPARPAPGQPLVAVSYNIGYLSGMTNNLPVARDEALFAANLGRAVGALGALKPDIVALQEIDFDATRSRHHDQAAQLAQGLGLGYVARAVNWDKRYLPFPYWPPREHFGQIVSGQAVISRYPLSGQQRVPLSPLHDKPFYYRAFYIERLAQVVLVDVGRPLAVVNVHLEAWDRPARLRQAGQVAELLARLMKDGPVLVLGDFNTTPPWASQKTGFADEPEQDYSGEQTLEIIAAVGLKEAFAHTPASAEAAAQTFPADRPTRKLDHIFYDPRHMEPLAWRVVAEAGQASDHLPVALTFRFKD